MRKILFIVVLLSLVFGNPLVTNAANTTLIWVNGNTVNTSISPQIINGHTFVPLRAIAEGLGSKVSWDNGLRKATVEKADKTIEFTIGNPEVTVNSTHASIELAPYIVEGSSMLPLRFIGEQFGLKVTWDPLTKAIYLDNTTISRITNLTSPIEHIVVVIEENHSYNQIVGSSNAPYMNSLIQKGALLTNAHGVTHPSQPNYLALFSGSTQGVKDDACLKPFLAPNLASSLINAQLTFTGYSEDLPRVGYTGCSSKGYARKHNPWIQFTNVSAALNRSLSDFPQDFSSLPTVSFVIPNHQNDMHDGTVKQADDWLKTNMDSYVTWANTHKSLLIVTWDEDDFAKDNHIPLILVGPMVKAGKYDDNVTHYNVLRTIEDAFHLPLLGDSKKAQPITSIWK
ncbi:MAG: Copper amine oxidase N-terminal protein [Bacilli bacterium]|nr:Copper amine oxidase N-terminal protein [Bacilli bacterium]